MDVFLFRILSMFANLEIPVALFNSIVKPSDIRKLCEVEMPILTDKLITHIERKMLRMTPK